MHGYHHILPHAVHVHGFCMCMLDHMQALYILLKIWCLIMPQGTCFHGNSVGYPWVTYGLSMAVNNPTILTKCTWCVCMLCVNNILSCFHGSSMGYHGNVTLLFPWGVI